MMAFVFAKPAHHGSEVRTDRRAGFGRLAEAAEQLDRVVEVRVEAEVANQGEPVGNRRLERHQLADVEAGDVGANRLELAAILGRGVRLHVVVIDMARAAEEVDEYDRLVGSRRIDGPLRLEPEQVRQRQPADREAAQPEEAATRAGALQVQHRSVRFAIAGGERYLTP